jgi:hypothetical protein
MKIVRRCGGDVSGIVAASVAVIFWWCCRWSLQRDLVAVLF